MVSVALWDEDWVGGMPVSAGGTVQVAIWARRRTVSRGYLMTSSKAEMVKVAMLQLAEWRTGSMLR